MRISIFIIAACSLLIATSSSRAETISIVDPQAQVSNIVTPQRGMDMKSVAAKFGEPSSKSAAVGKPPISRWQYEKFEVFFEYDKVVHSTITRP